jgi:hypothetical protein
MTLFSQRFSRGVKPHPTRIFRYCLMVVLLTAGGITRGQATSAMLIEKVLDDPAQINFRNVTLEDAFEKLGKSIGVKFDVSEMALAQLPYGGLTELSAVQLQGMAWRDALRELLKPLSLRFQPGEDRIYILGTAALMRQPRRLNMVELDALVRLQSTNLNDSEDKMLKQIQQITRIPFGLIENDRLRDKTDDDITDKLLSKIPQPTSKVLDQYSDRVVRSLMPKTTGSWYVRAEVKEGRAERIDIIILPVEELVELKLERRINVEFKNRPSQVIFYELSRQAALDIRYEPGCFALLDNNLRNNCSLVMSGGTIKRALEALAGMTGLAYSYDDKGIYIQAGEMLKSTPAAQVNKVTYANPLILTLTTKIPGTDLETMILIREEDLNEEGLLEKWQQVQMYSIEEFIQFLKNYQAPVPAEKK